MEINSTSLQYQQNIQVDANNGYSKVGAIGDNISNGNMNEIDVQEKRSSLSGLLNAPINKISEYMQINKLQNEQVDILEKIKEVAVKNENTSIDDFVKQFNFIEDTISEKNKKIQDDIIKSRDYFDGLYGADRLSPDEIIKQATKRMEKLKEAISDTDKNIQEIQKEITKTINNEILKSKEEAQSNQYDFGKESKDFSSNIVNNIAGSVVLSQGNVNTSQIHKQVLY